MRFHMHPFNVTNLLTCCLLTYYFSFWFLIFFEKSILFMQKPNVNSALQCLHSGHAKLLDFSTGSTSSTGPDLWSSSSPDLTLVYCKIWGIIQHRVCRLTLTNWTSASRMLNVALTMQHNWQYSWQVATSSLIMCTGKIWIHKQLVWQYWYPFAFSHMTCNVSFSINFLSFWYDF